VSALRALCPDCRTRTAVAVGETYECHVCGREFAAAIVRVPRAWGSGGEAMAAAAALELPYPEAAVIEHDTLAAQTAALPAALPAHPIVVGGCCCSHTGAIVGLSQRVGRLGVVWLDAHGDLNTPETSPSGNAWGMPLRAAIDAGAVRAADIALAGARELDPPEVEFVAAVGIDDDLTGLLPMSMPSTSPSTPTSWIRRSSAASCPSRTASQSTRLPRFSRLRSRAAGSRASASPVSFPGMRMPRWSNDCLQPSGCPRRGRGDGQAPV